MKRITGPRVVPFLIAVSCVSLLVFLQWLRPSLVVPVEIAAGDYLFLRQDGPHLGYRPVRDDIVLVLMDSATSRARGGMLPGFEDDIRLYRTLIDAGAKVIADTHMIAAADEAAMQPVRPLLDALVDMRNGATVLCDIWTPVNTPPEDHELWMPNIAPVVTNMHPSAYKDYETRIFPLATFMNSGPVETMPLRIVRAYRGLAQLDNAAIDRELERCGIFVSWAVREDESEYRSKSPPYYHVGELPVRWLGFPSNSILVPPAGLYVSYEAPPSQFKRFSYQDVLEGRCSDDFRGKIVIIGRSAQIDPTDQTYSVPSSLEKVSIAEVVGAAVQTLLDERFPEELPWAWGLLVVLGLVTAVTFAAARLRPLTAVGAVLVLILGYYAIATVAYRNGWLLSVLLVPATSIVAGVFGGVYQLFLARRARTRIVDLFGRYVPRAVVHQLVQKPDVEALVVGGIRRNVTVMFADIRGFTTFSEALEPERVLVELNSLLDGMVDCTFQAEGTLDKFIGDAILVLFNAPLEQPDHARRAVATAIKIQTRVAGHRSGLSIGIGIHSGDAVVGNIGTPERMEYTAIGSTVNVASRLCDAAKPGEIVVSAVVARQLAGQFQFTNRAPIRVKGIQNELEIFTVAGRSESDNGPASSAESRPNRER